MTSVSTGAEWEAGSPALISSERLDPASTAGERHLLIGFLRYHRSTLALKCEGLAESDLARRSVPPSSLSLLGLVRHVTEVEGSWMRLWAGETYTPRYYSDERLDDDFDALDSASVPAVKAAWAAEAAHTDEVLSREPLDVEGAFHPRLQRPVPTLRWVAVHLIEEYARHNGHADLLRQVIDGATGE